MPFSRNTAAVTNDSKSIELDVESAKCRHRRQRKQPVINVARTDIRVIQTDAGSCSSDQVDAADTEESDSSNLVDESNPVRISFETLD